jgi:hypothetical protein
LGEILPFLFFSFFFLSLGQHAQGKLFGNFSKRITPHLEEESYEITKICGGYGQISL